MKNIVTSRSSYKQSRNYFRLQRRKWFLGQVYIKAADKMGRFKVKLVSVCSDCRRWGLWEWRVILWYRANLLVSSFFSESGVVILFQKAGNKEVLSSTPLWKITLVTLPWYLCSLTKSICHQTGEEFLRKQVCPTHIHAPLLPVPGMPHIKSVDSCSRDFTRDIHSYSTRTKRSTWEYLI